MYIAIDDTYGHAGDGKSEYVTNRRRTHLAVIFPDSEVQHIRTQIRKYLNEVTVLTGISAKEFHFVEIYNRSGPWEPLREDENSLNIKLFEFFACIYSKYKWPVFIQTVDDRTFADHGIGKIHAQFDGLDLGKREDISLFMLITKIKAAYKGSTESINLVIDEGRKKPGNLFGNEIFHDWQGDYHGTYQSSSAEALLQISDFLAFCVNRVTHTSLKQNRTDMDNWFIKLVSAMEINCRDLSPAALPINFNFNDIDAIHRIDRIRKGIESSN